VQSLHCLFLAGASTARLLLRVGLAGGRLQVHVHHVLLLRRRERLHPRQRRGDLAEQRLHGSQCIGEVQTNASKAKASRHWRNRNLTLMLNPAFALVSMNMTLSSLDLLSPSSVDTCLQQARQKYQTHVVSV
jgi:hypothetical protein